MAIYDAKYQNVNTQINIISTNDTEKEAAREADSNRNNKIEVKTNLFDTDKKVLQLINGRGGKSVNFDLIKLHLTRELQIQIIDSNIRSSINKLLVLHLIEEQYPKSGLFIISEKGRSWLINNEIY